jgi:fatty-acyl-CoA synthase
MRLSFSTRGWGDVPWDELVETAADMGFAGVEVYDALGNERLSGKGGPFDRYNLRATARDLRNRGLEMPVFDTPIDISLSGEQVDNGLRLINMAAEVGAKFVCVKAQHGTEDAVRAAEDNAERAVQKTLEEAQSDEDEQATEADE